MNEIKKSKNDDRKYKRIILENKLEIINIIDEKTEISSVALSVNIGSYNDYEEYEGIAHFLEHMLFMGTKKYPDEKYFFNYINKHGGKTNAFTGNEMTTYYYEINSKKLKKSLDIFSEFFKNPLFKKETVKNEIKSVDSEHLKNYKLDVWRKNRILKEIIDNKKHPLKKFSTGNKETLDKKNIREKVKEFYEENYSSNIMKLVIIHNKDETEYIKKKFNEIKNKNIIKSYYNKPFKINEKDEEYYKMVKWYPISKEKILDLFWQLDNIDEYYKIKPLEYISEILCNKSKNSLYDYLLNNELITSMNTEIYEKDNNMTIYNLNIILTKKGEEKVKKIYDLIYNYIEMIKEKGIKKWRYEEIKKKNDILIEYLQRGEDLNYVMTIATELHVIPTKDILLHSMMYKKYNNETKEIILSLIEKLNKRNCIVLMSTKKEEELDKIEKIYKTKYKIYEKEIWKKEKKQEKKLELTKKNIFNLDEVKIYEIEKKEKYPKKYYDNEKIKIWYKQNYEYNDYNTIIGIKIINFDIRENIKNYVNTLIYCNILEHNLREKIYYANRANTDINIIINYDNITIEISGYIENVKKLIKIIIEEIKEIKIKKKKLLYVKGILKNNLINYENRPLYVLGNDMIIQKIYKKSYSDKKILNYINNEKIEKEDVKKIKNIIKNSIIKILIQGNIREKDVTEIKKMFKLNYDKEYKKMNNEILANLENGEEEIYIRMIEDNKDKEYNKKNNKENNNNLIKIFYEIDMINIKDKEWIKKYIYTLLINLYTNEKFFSELRIKQQLGYIVTSNIEKIGSGDKRILGLYYMIQSKIDINELKERIKKFIIKTYEDIKKIKDEEYELLITRLKIFINRRDNNIYDEYYRNKSLLDGEEFDIKEKMINKIKEINKEELKRFYYEKLINKKTRKIRMIKIHKN